VVQVEVEITLVVQVVMVLVLLIKVLLVEVLGLEEQVETLLEVVEVEQERQEELMALGLVEMGFLLQ
jgi:hypothetical protein